MGRSIHDFDIDNHVTRVVLGAPGTWVQLEAMVARLHETPLPRNQPLWAFYYIEGLESGQVAWFCKYHHACIDGMAGQAIIDVLFSRDPTTDTPIAQPAVERTRTGRARSHVRRGTIADRSEFRLDVAIDEPA